MRRLDVGQAGPRRVPPAQHTRNLRLIRQYQRDPNPPMRRPGLRSVADLALQNTIGQNLGQTTGAWLHPGRSGGMMMYPMGGKIPLKEYAASVPGFTMRRVKEGQPTLDYMGVEAPHAKYRAKGFSNVAYNLHGPNNELVGSVHLNFSSPYRDRKTGVMQPADLFVSDMYLDPKLRHTTLGRDLMNPILAGAAGRKVVGDIINPKLLSLARRMAKRDPRYEHFLGAQAADVMPANHVPGLTPIQPRMGRPL